MQQPRIWLVEDEQSIADTLVYMLQQEGFQVSVFGRGLPALEAAAHQAPDVAILDVGLPDISGFELCHRIRASSQIPLLFLTARSEEQDRLLGLEMGADDYVAKPFSPREVSARVRTILRRTQLTPAPVSPATGLQLDEVRARITLNGHALNLTRYEYLLLKTLRQQPERVYSRQQLMELVWADAEESLERTVDTHIKTLRAKLREIDPQSQLILTHRGLGYSLCA